MKTTAAIAILAASVAGCHAVKPERPLSTAIPAVLGTVSPQQVSGIRVGMKRHEVENLINPNSGGPPSPMSIAVFDGTNTWIMRVHYGPDDMTVTEITWQLWGGKQGAEPQGGGYSPPAARSSKPTP